MGADSRLRAEISREPLGVTFDPEHLRRVLVNLLDNAHRHASGAAGSVFLRLAPRDEGWVVLSVLSDGAPIAPEVERRLFEPFFSTRSRGSVWACIFAASCANVMAPASNTAPAPLPSDCATNSW